MVEKLNKRMERIKRFEELKKIEADKIKNPKKYYKA